MTLCHYIQEGVFLHYINQLGSKLSTMTDKRNENTTFVSCGSFSNVTPGFDRKKTPTTIIMCSYTLIS